MFGIGRFKVFDQTVNPELVIFETCGELELGELSIVIIRPEDKTIDFT